MRIPKAIMDPMGNRPPNSDRDPFLGASLALGTALELLLGPPTAPITAGCIKSTFFLSRHNPMEKWFIVVA